MTQILRLGLPALSGLLAGAAAIRWAMSSVAAGSFTGAELLAVLLMWSVGTAATAFGVASVAFYAVGLAQRSCRSAAPHKEGGRRECQLSAQKDSA